MLNHCIEKECLSIECEQESILFTTQLLHVAHYAHILRRLPCCCCCPTGSCANDIGAVSSMLGICCDERCDDRCDDRCEDG